MARPQILVVEDESIVAEDMKAMLEGFGYAVPAIAFSGEEAVKKVLDTRPDLVLMDIVLKGQMSGVEAVEHIRSRCNVPVVYVTAYADETTVRRAKVTEPFGYILKPFDAREVQTTIEIALYKHRMDKQLRASEQWLGTTLRSLGDAVLATDTQGRITFMNPHAEALTGWTQAEAIGRHATEVLLIRYESPQSRAEHPIAKVLREGGHAIWQITTWFSWPRTGPNGRSRIAPSRSKTTRAVSSVPYWCSATLASVVSCRRSSSKQRRWRLSGGCQVGSPMTSTIC
jgi:PAS domain S-box-containing protein